MTNPFNPLSTTGDRVGEFFTGMSPEQYRQWRADKAAADRKRFPSEAEQRASLRWTEQHDRPTAPGSGLSGVALDRAQRVWDEAEAKRKVHVAAVDRLEADRKELDAAQQAEIDKKRAAFVAAEDAKLVDGWRRRFFASDRTATEQDFQSALPEIRRQHRIDAAMGRTEVPELEPMVRAW